MRDQGTAVSEGLRRERSRESFNATADAVTTGAAASAIGLTLLEQKSATTIVRLAAIDPGPGTGDHLAHSLGQQVEHAAEMAALSTNGPVVAKGQPVEADQQARQETEEPRNWTAAAEPPAAQPHTDQFAAAQVESAGIEKPDWQDHPGLPTGDEKATATSPLDGAAPSAPFESIASTVSSTLGQIGAAVDSAVASLSMAVRGLQDLLTTGAATTDALLPVNELSALQQDLPETTLPDPVLPAPAGPATQIDDMLGAAVATASEPMPELVSIDGLAEGLPLQLGFIGQSLADQVEVGGHSPSGLLHGLV